MNYKQLIMSKIKYTAIGFVLGALFMYILPNLFITQIYVTARDVKLSNNSVIAKSTQLIKYKRMPEGFTTYILYINTDDCHVVRKQPNRLERRNYVIPYWIKEDAK